MWSSTVVTLFLVTLILMAGVLIDGSKLPPIIKFTVAGKAYTLYSNKLNWFEAMEHCRRENKIFGSIPSLEVNQMLVDSLKPYEVDDNSNSIWLGAYDIDHESEFVWLSTGRTVDSFTNWVHDGPDNWREAEHCVEMFANGLWNDAFCKLKKHTFCEELPT